MPSPNIGTVIVLLALGVGVDSAVIDSLILDGVEELSTLSASSCRDALIVVESKRSKAAAMRS